MHMFFHGEFLRIHHPFTVPVLHGLGQPRSQHEQRAQLRPLRLSVAFTPLETDGSTEETYPDGLICWFKRLLYNNVIYKSPCWCNEKQATWWGQNFASETWRFANYLSTKKTDVNSNIGESNRHVEVTKQSGGIWCLNLSQQTGGVSPTHENIISPADVQNLL